MTLDRVIKRAMWVNVAAVFWCAVVLGMLFVPPPKLAHAARWFMVVESFSDGTHREQMCVQFTDPFGRVRTVCTPWTDPHLESPASATK